MTTAQQPIANGQIWKNTDHKQERFVKVLDHAVDVVKIITTDANGNEIEGKFATHAKRVRFGQSNGYTLHRDLTPTIKDV